MKDKALYPVVYMFVVTAFFSSVIIGIGVSTRGRVKANEQLAFERAVLEVFNLSKDKTPAELHQTYVDVIKGPDDSSGGAYIWTTDGAVGGYAVVFEGKGFWATIKGVIGIGPDKKTIMGVSFYEQNETPGLGGEIVKPGFCEQFEGKVIYEGDRPIGIRPFGSELGDNEVHAITGATQTCTRLEKILNDSLTEWLESVGSEGWEK